MLVVRHAAQARALIAASLLAAGLGACGGSEKGSSSTPATTPTGTIAVVASARGGADLGDLRAVNCQAWTRGSEAARRGTVEDLREFASGPVGSPAGNGAQLDNDAAYAFLDRYCANAYAAYFKLYKLYTRAAAFTPQG
jgi:hypothetical protein